MNDRPATTRRPNPLIVNGEQRDYTPIIRTPDDWDPDKPETWEPEEIQR
jgi:hypothetical protein